MRLYYDRSITLSVPVEHETVWLNRSQMAEFKTQTHMVEHYNLDVIISVGYRVKSKQGVEFRKWANSIIKKYIIDGYAINESVYKRLRTVAKIATVQNLSLR